MQAKGEISERSYAVRMFRDGDQEGILALFNEVFAKSRPDLRRNRTQWDWEYGRRGVLPQVAVATDRDNKIIAHYGGIPLRARVDGENVMFAHVVDTMVDPAWRRGLASGNVMLATAKEYFRHYGEGSEIYAGYGFPNWRAIRLGERELQYRRLFDPLPTLYCNLFDPDQGMHTPATDLVLDRIDRFAAESDALWRDLESQYPLALIRDASYLNWRYVDNPRNFRCYLIRDAAGGVRGMTVFCERWMGQPILAVVDYLAARDDCDCLAAALGEAMKIARVNEQTRVEIWLPERSREFRDALSFGLRREPSLFIMCDRQHRDMRRREWCQDHWYYTIGDSDVH